MARFPLALPPGVFRNGTEYQAKGRYYDAYLVRWYGIALGPIGGWRAHTADTVSGAPRASLSWRDNSGNSWLSVATHSNLYASDILGVVYDITPDDFTSGRADASGVGGYGSGNYGASTYGTPRPGTTQILPATQWTLDRWGEDLVGVSPDDRKIYEWALNTSDQAAAVENAPDCDALVVTEEGFLFALCTTDPRTLSWCDQQNNTVWSPDATNQAGDYPLQTAGHLMCGKSVQGQTLLFTDLDVWSATYAANNNVYDFAKKGDACGIISRQAVASFEMKAFWVSPDLHFWQYNGYVQPIECDVRDYILRDINMLQASKVFCVHNAANFEIEVYYCSSASTEIDRCVVWNYKGDSEGVPYWNIGRPPRTCGTDAGAFQYPIRVDIGGNIYDHEVGLNYDGQIPYATGGPIEIGNGDTVMHAKQLFPDDATLGDVTATFYGRNNPDDVEIAYGPYSLSSQTDLRFVARALKVKFSGASMANWRVGIPSLDMERGGMR